MSFADTSRRRSSSKPFRPWADLRLLYEESPVGDSPVSICCDLPGHQDDTPSMKVYPDHAYCVTPDTPVLMRDFGWKPIGDLLPGEVLVGFEEVAEGNRRGWREARVQAARRVAAPLLRVVTASREVFCTPDHLFLSGKGLAPRGNSIWRTAESLKPGHFIRSVPVVDLAPTEDYLRGYLYGTTLGDGTYRYDPSLSYGEQPTPYWRLAMKDKEPLLRLHRYLLGLGVRAFVRPFDCGSRNPDHAPLWKIEVRSGDGIDTISRLLQPLDTQEFWRGFLAGIFDAEGSYGRGDLIVACGKGSAVVDMAAAAAARFGFTTRVREAAGRDVKYLALVGRMPDKLRFFSTARPAIGRKGDLFFERSAQFDDEEVLSVEPAGEGEVVEIATSTKTLITNGLASHNCYGCSTWEGWFDHCRRRGLWPTRLTKPAPLAHLVEVSSGQTNRSAERVKSLTTEELLALVDLYHRRLYEQGKQAWLQSKDPEGGRGLHKRTIDRFKLGHTGRAYSIPVWDLVDGKLELRTIRYRRDDALPTNEKGNKYWGTAGRNELYLFAPVGLGPKVILCEGEYDTLVAVQAGYTAVTFTNGIGSFDPEPFLDRFRGVEELVIATDQDGPGYTGARQLAGFFRDHIARVRIAEWWGKDLTHLYLARGRQGLHQALGGVDCHS